jgi:serine/threonine protein phosphatase 1
MARVFAIGDIHGCSKTFQKLLFDKIKIQKSDKIYCIGDYIDRGKDSKGVIDFILMLRKEGYHIHTLRGNHEQLMMDSTKSEKNFKHWKKNGGDATLKSFRISSYKKMKPVYKNFFQRTKYFIKSGNFIFVHAGLNFHSDFPFEDKYSMLWIRNFEIDNERLGNRYIIHGHTPKSMDFILKQQGKRAINIDAGCVYKHQAEYGNLIALNITENKLISIRNIED